MALYDGDPFDDETLPRRPGVPPSDPTGLNPAPPPVDQPPPHTSQPNQGGWAKTPVLVGWNPDKWNDPNHNTTKYKVGRIFGQYGQQYGNNNQALAAAWPEIQKLFPNAKFDGKDKIDFGDGYGPIDVMQANVCSRFFIFA